MRGEGLEIPDLSPPRWARGSTVGRGRALGSPGKVGIQGSEAAGRRASVPGAGAQRLGQRKLSFLEDIRNIDEKWGAGGDLDA